jgi:hypothetical protein
MLTLKHTQSPITEALSLIKALQPTDEQITVKSTTDRYNQKRIIVVSDIPDAKKASNETFAVRSIMRKYGAAWDEQEKQWYWSDFKIPMDQMLRKANDAVKAANEFLKHDISGHKEITSYDDIEQLTQVKDFLENVKGAYESIKATSGKVTENLINNYIDQLADSLDDKKLLDDIANFNRAAKAYVLESGRQTYSFNNFFLIWLQASKGSSEFGSIPYWLGRGYQPIENARKIFIIKRSDSGSLVGNVYKIVASYPKSPQEFAKESGIKLLPNKKMPIPKEKHHAFWVWAKNKGYFRTNSSPKGFNEVAIYDDKNVEPIPGKEQLNAPEPPKWFNDSNTEDEKSSIMIKALKIFSQNKGIKISDKEDLGGAQGVSKGGHIELLTNSLGAGLLSTFIHELAHELLHHEVNKDLGFYVGKGSGPEERELQAESVAYTVMKTYDFPIQHSINYLALWKSNKDKIKEQQKLIRNVAMYIINQIETYAPEVADQNAAEEINEALSSIKNIITEFKKTIL